MDIDWSEAPEWADAYIIDTNGDNPPAFHKSKGNRWVDSNGEYWPKGSSNVQVITRPTKPAAPEWDGEGLPPVGVVVAPDWSHLRYRVEWVGGDRQVLISEIGLPDKLKITTPERLRPIRTPEQRKREGLRRDLMRTIDQSTLDMNGCGTMVSVENAANAILSRYNLEPKP